MKISAGLAVASAVACVLAAPATAYATVVDDSFAFSEVKYNECTNEDVAFAGTFHIIYRDAGQHLMVHLNPIGVTGVGQTSGTTYQFVGAPYNITINTDPGLAYTQVNNLVLASRGSSANLVVRFVEHYTVDANGLPRAEFTFFEPKCVA
jgi:hypothetical protein